MALQRKPSLFNAAQLISHRLDAFLQLPPLHRPLKPGIKLRFIDSHGVGQIVRGEGPVRTQFLGLLDEQFIEADLR